MTEQQRLRKAVLAQEQPDREGLLARVAAAPQRRPARARRVALGAAAACLLLALCLWLAPQEQPELVGGAQQEGASLQAEALDGAETVRGQVVECWEAQGQTWARIRLLEDGGGQAEGDTLLRRLAQPAQPGQVGRFTLGEEPVQVEWEETP